MSVPNRPETQAKPEASTSNTSCSAPRVETITVHGGGSIQSYVSSALELLTQDKTRPAVQLCMSNNGKAAQAMHKLVSCAELIKREYIKAVSTPRRREKLPASLWQYNHLFNAASTVRGEQAVEQDGDATQAHHEVIQQLVVDVDGKNGRKRPKKEHQPRLTIILSTKKLPHTDGKRVHFQTRPTASKLTGGHHSFQPPSDKKKTRRRHKASDKNISSEQRGEDHGDLSQGRRGGEVPKASGASSSTQEYSQQAQPRKAAYSQSQTQSSATQEEDTGEPMQTD